MLCLRISFVFLFVLFVEKSVGQDLTLAGSQLRSLIGQDLEDLIEIPDQKFKRGSVYDIKVVKADYPDVKLSLQGNTLTIEVKDFNIELAAKWKIQLRLGFKASGTVTLEATGIKIKLKVDLHTLKVKSCDDSIKKVAADFKGKNIGGLILSFIADTFRGRVNRRIKKRLDGRVCKAVTSLINKNSNKIKGWLGQDSNPKPTEKPKTTTPRRPGGNCPSNKPCADDLR